MGQAPKSYFAALGSEGGRGLRRVWRGTPIPAWMWRVAFGIAVLVWGGGIVAYFVLRTCIPDERKRGA